MAYETIFDISREGLSHLLLAHWMVLTIPWIFVYSSMIWVLDRGNIRIKISMGLRYVLLVLFVSLAVFGIYMTTSDYLDFRNALDENKCSVVTGVVTNFDPMPWGGHKEESFLVNGLKFSYSNFEPSVGFNNSASHGGPIRDGLNVRIHYLDGKILRLELAK
jgi:hypothetical protein